MSHKEFPPSVTQETISAYFWAGVAVGVLPFQNSKDWAFSVIEQLDAPPIEIIEVATANDRNSALDALQASAHGADQQVAGRLLLADIHTQLKAGDMFALEATRAAMRVAQTTGLPDHVYYALTGWMTRFSWLLTARTVPQQRSRQISLRLWRSMRVQHNNSFKPNPLRGSA